MDETTPVKPVRKTPGKMTTWVGEWSGSLESNDLRFNAKAVLTEDTPAARRALLLKLGEGNYDTITGRAGDLAYHKKSVDTFAV